MDNMKEIILLVALALLVFLISRFGKKQGGNTRSARLMKKYATITRETFDAIPEDELVDAAVSRVLAKAAATRRPDPIKVLADLPHGNTVVYSVWAVCKELAGHDYRSLTHTATREMVEPAETALDTLGASATATALRALRAAHEAGEDTTDAEAAFHRAVETECPLSLCGEYMRDHAEDFIDA